VGVPSQVGNEGLWPGKRGFGIHHPILGVGLLQPLLQGDCRRKK
jgi:hypothetical protein